MRELLLQQTKPQTLLAQKRTRRILLDLLKPAEAVQLSRVLDVRAADPYVALAGIAYSPVGFQLLANSPDVFGLEWRLGADDASSIPRPLGRKEEVKLSHVRLGPTTPIWLRGTFTLARR
jgi:hypothetical protein